MRNCILSHFSALILAGVIYSLGALPADSSPTQSQTASGDSNNLRPVADANTGGILSVSHWDIPEGTIVSVTHDLEVNCGGDILIHGQLIAAASSGDGINITLRTPGTVIVAGSIRAGDGEVGTRVFASSGEVDLTGRLGGSIIIEAAAVVGAGEIRAGDGGAGVLGGRGGDGGQVIVQAATASLEGQPPLTVRAGAGGRGGDGVPGFNSGGGGSGGDGGDAFILPSGTGAPGDPGDDDIKTGCAGNGIPFPCCGLGCFSIHPHGYNGASAIGGDGGDGGNGTACGDGGAGGRGGDAQSECGGNGADGLDCDPDGQNGFSGGAGGTATGGRGGNGGHGEECCCGPNGPGGDGGSGGRGGNAVSGYGGDGGDGGKSTRVFPQLPGEGGDGGKGGNGGAATGGRGGNGGSGANGIPKGTGGPAGAGGTASAGIGGIGGVGGSGIPWGTPGADGSSGIATQGISGTAGAAGRANCAPHSLMSSVNDGSLTVPAPSPGTQVGQTAIDEQSHQTSSHRVGRNSEVPSVSLAWTECDQIPAMSYEDCAVVRYQTYDPRRTPILMGSWLGAGTTHPELAMDDADLATVVLEGVCSTDPLKEGIWLATSPLYNSVALVPQEMLPCTPNCSYVEPRIATTQRSGMADITHVVIRPMVSECLNDPLLYWRYDGISWSGPALIDTPAGYEYSIAASPLADKVAVVLFKEVGGLTNIIYHESVSNGVGWLNGTELGTGIQISNYADPGSGDEAGYHTACIYDRLGTLHIVWDECRPATGNSATILRHWSPTTGIQSAAAALWESPAAPGTNSLNLSQLTLGLGDGCTECEGGSITNDGFLYLLYTQFGGHTSIEQNDYSALGFMNGELYLTTSTDGGMTWSPPSNLTNTKTPGCNPGVATPGNPNPPNPDGVCRSEHWASLNPVVSDLDILFISDLDAGAATQGEGTWQLNPVHYFSIPGGATDATHVCPPVGANWYAFVGSPDYCPPHAPPGGTDDDGALVVHNMGNGALTGTINVATTIGPPGTLKINGGTVPIALSLDPAVTNETSVNVTLDAAGIATEGLYGGVITITSNGQPSPFQIPVDLYVFNDYLTGDDCPTYTPLGTMVSLQLNESVSITFAEVTSPGLTAVTTGTNGPPSDPGFVLLPSGTPLYYDIQTTAEFTPPVSVCFTYDPALDPWPDCPFPMKLVHYDESAWADVTTEWACEAHIVCGEVSTLSPFSLAQSVCLCQCHGDPGGNCDDLQTVLDVVVAVNVAFRNASAVPDPSATCPHTTTDVNCDGVTTVLDVVKFVSVAFRAANPSTELCDPCP